MENFKFCEQTGFAPDRSCKINIRIQFSILKTVSTYLKKWYSRTIFMSVFMIAIFDNLKIVLGSFLPKISIHKRNDFLCLCVILNKHLSNFSPQKQKLQKRVDFHALQHTLFSALVSQKLDDQTVKVLALLKLHFSLVPKGKQRSRQSRIRNVSDTFW